MEEKKQEEAKKIELVGSDWTPDDVAMLTKGIVKFPPGTGNRWKVIAEFVGKNQKEVIAKAK